MQADKKLLIFQNELNSLEKRVADLEKILKVGGLQKTKTSTTPRPRTPVNAPKAALIATNRQFGD